MLVESSQGLHLCAVLNKNYGSTAATPKPCAVLKHLFLGIAIIDIRKTCKVVGHRVEVEINNCVEKHMELRCSNELFSEKVGAFLVFLKTQSCLCRKVFHMSFVFDDLSSLIAGCTFFTIPMHPGWNGSSDPPIKGAPGGSVLCMLKALEGFVLKMHRRYH